MNPSASPKPFIAIACGGTGGHLFPGLAVAQQLQERGCDVALLISPKEVDQQAVKSVLGMEIFTLRRRFAEPELFFLRQKFLEFLPRDAKVF